MRLAIAFRTDLLEASETFIKDQILALTYWRVVLAGYRRIPSGLPLDELDVRIVPGLANIWQRLWLRLCQWLDIAHPQTVHALREINADLVHVHFGTNAVDVWPSIRKIGLPLVITLHGYDINIYREWWEAGRGGFRRRSYPKKLLKLANEPNVRFIAVSNAVRTRAIEFGIHPSKIVLCYTGIDTKKFIPGTTPIIARSNRILFIGRLVKNKGVEVLIRAIHIAKSRVPDIELFVAGDGPLRGELTELSKRLHVKAEFLGNVSPDKIINQLHMAKLVCQPSITIENGESEALGMAILEAQACGIPIISSARGGSTEGMVDGQTGFRFTEGGFKELAELIEIVLTNDALLSKLSYNATKFIPVRFSIVTCTKAVEQIYFDHAGTGHTKGGQP